MSQISNASGGVGTAAGLGYQYLVAVEDVLDHMAKHPAEDFVLESEDHVSDVVDYSITDPDGIRLLSVQAKSSVDGPQGKRMGVPEIAGILLQLIEHDSQRYLIRTNRRLTTAGEALRSALVSLDPSTATSPGVIEIIGPHLSPGWLTEAIDAGINVSRLARCVVLCEPVDLDVLRSQIEGKAQHQRRLRGDGTGRHTAEVLVGYLTSQILHLSSRRKGRRLDRAGLERLLGVPNLVLAGAAGEIDWGVPLGPVPVTRTIGRTEALAGITKTFSGPPVGAVRRVALTGLSGIGKSTVARLYLDTARHYYDRILWIDAHSTEAIREAVSACVGIDARDASTDIVAEQFKFTISRVPATWLLVFDNAPDDRTVAPWLPVVGAIDMLATSTNSAGWGQWHRNRLHPMTDPQAIALLCERLELASLDADAERDALRLCGALGNWPLAIELACGFLADSGRGLEMTDAYLDRLKEHIIDDETLVPPDYRSHPSLLQAISIALDTVTSRDDRLPLRAMALIETLAYLPPRSAPLQLAGGVTVAAESMAGRYQLADEEDAEPGSETEQHVEIAVRQLSMASLVHRVQAPETAGGDLVRTNDIVLDVVRGHHSNTARLRVLGLLQLVLSDQIRSAVDTYKFNNAERLATSALTTIDFSELFRAYTPEGITLIGNMANMFAHRGDPESAQSLYRQELGTMDRLDLDAPVLRAIIHSNISSIQIQNNAPIGEIRQTIDSAIYYLGRCAIDLGTHHSVAQAATQVYENVQLLAGSDSWLSVEVTDRWVSFLVDSFPDVKAGSAFREFHDQLRSLGNNDSATLGGIEERLRVETSPAVHLQLLFLRGDALASLERYEESIDAFREALVQADARAIGLSAGWVEVLNAWRTAAFRVLEMFDMEALEFCRQMDSLVDALRPHQTDDSVTLELCGVVTRVLDHDLDESSARVEALAGQAIAPTHLAPHPEGSLLAIAACQRIVRLRQSASGAPIVPLRAWGLGGVWTAQGPQRRVFAAMDSSHVEHMPPFGLAGRWVCDENGAGLLIGGESPVLAWSPMRETWWMEWEDANTVPATVRLREVIVSPGFAADRRNVLVGSAYEGSDQHIIDPDGPIIEIAIFG